MQVDRWLSGGVAGIHRLVEVFVILLFVAMLTVGFTQIVNRFFLGTSLSWSEEFQRFAHIWLVFLSIPIGYRRAAHIGVDLLQQRLAPRAAHVSVLLIDLCWLGLGAALIFTTRLLMAVASRQTAPALRITMDWVYLGLVLAGAYLVIVALQRLAGDVRAMRTAA